MDENPYEPPQFGEPADPWLLWLASVPLLIALTGLIIAVLQIAKWLPTQPWFMVAWITSAVAGVAYVLVRQILPRAWIQRVTPYFIVATLILLVTIGPRL
jgi:hypothetical protein